MKIKDSTLRQIIREEYGRLINEGDDADPKAEALKKLKAASEAESNHILRAMIDGATMVLKRGETSPDRAIATAKGLKGLSSAAAKALK